MPTNSLLFLDDFASCRHRTRATLIKPFGSERRTFVVLSWVSMTYKGLSERPSCTTESRKDGEDSLRVMIGGSSGCGGASDPRRRRDGREDEDGAAGAVLGRLLEEEKVGVKEVPSAGDFSLSQSESLTIERGGARSWLEPAGITREGGGGEREKRERWQILERRS